MIEEKYKHTALLWFRVENCRSYKNPVELDFTSTRRSLPEVVRSVVSDSKGRKTGLLPVAGVFGANASGKSAIIQAISDLRLIVLNSFKEATDGGGIRRLPFLLDSKSKKSDTSFAIELILDGVRCEYGIDLNDSAVTSEYFYHYPNGSKALVFEREGDQYKFGSKFKLPKNITTKLRKNTALLSLAGPVEWSLASRLFHWFKNEIRVVDEWTRKRALERTAKLASSESRRQIVLDLLSAADLGITDIESEPPPKEIVEQVRKMFDAVTGEENRSKMKPPVVGEKVTFTHCGEKCSPLSIYQESIGTVAWAGLIHPILHALENGSFLMVDELDTSLHPMLVHLIIEIFQSNELNPNTAQLLFNAHDLTIFSASDQELLGRDQIWFTEKNELGVTSLCSLVEYKPRKDESLQPRYLGGRYGGVPLVDNSKVREAIKLLHAES